MKVPPNTVRRIRKLLEEVVYLDSDREPGAPSLERMARDATALLPLLGQRKPPRKALPFMPRKAAKRAKVATRRERVGEIREAVAKRTSGQCELCGLLMLDGAELHHLESGSGTRRALESVSTCMLVHHECHRAYHRRPLAFIREVTAWAKEHGYPIPSRFRGLEAQP